MRITFLKRSDLYSYAASCFFHFVSKILFHVILALGFAKPKPSIKFYHEITYSQLSLLFF